MTTDPIIHVAYQSPTEQSESPVLHLSLVGKDSIEQLYKLLNRSLNCNPEAPKTWFELSDVLEKVLR
jgi:hypothetical protein